MSQKFTSIDSPGIDRNRIVNGNSRIPLDKSLFLSISSLKLNQGAPMADNVVKIKLAELEIESDLILNKMQLINVNKNSSSSLNHS